jgi:transposase
MVDQLDERIRRVDARFETLVYERDVSIVASIPGVSWKSAAEITAEIGDARRFADGNRIASAAGLAPSVYQSARKNLTG